MFRTEKPVFIVVFIPQLADKANIWLLQDRCFIIVVGLNTIPEMKPLNTSYMNEAVYFYYFPINLQSTYVPAEAITTHNMVAYSLTITKLHSSGLVWNLLGMAC